MTDMISEKEKLNKQLDKMGLVLKDIPEGEDPDSESVLRSLRHSLENLERYNLKEIIEFNSDGSPTQDKVQRDHRVLEGFKNRADEIKSKVSELKRELGRELMKYAEDHLRCYSYNDYQIESVVDQIVSAADLDQYEEGYQFWLPSNFGC